MADIKTCPVSYTSPNLNNIIFVKLINIPSLPLYLSYGIHWIYKSRYHSQDSCFSSSLNTNSLWETHNLLDIIKSKSASLLISNEI